MYLLFVDESGKPEEELFALVYSGVWGTLLGLQEGGRYG